MVIKMNEMTTALTVYQTKKISFRKRICKFLAVFDRFSKRVFIINRRFYLYAFLAFVPLFFFFYLVFSFSSRNAVAVSEFIKMDNTYKFIIFSTVAFSLSNVVVLGKLIACIYGLVCVCSSSALLCSASIDSNLLCISKIVLSSLFLLFSIIAMMCLISLSNVKLNFFSKKQFIKSYFGCSLSFITISFLNFFFIKILIII